MIKRIKQKVDRNIRCYIKKITVKFFCLTSWKYNFLNIEVRRIAGERNGYKIILSVTQVKIYLYLIMSIYKNSF